MTSALDMPLGGLRVVDLTTVLFGPYATQILGDLGAEVIKVESPAGDNTRGIGPARHAGMAAGFLACNRNKRSVVLDLKRPAARQALWRLIDGADLFVHNSRPAKVAALGFGPDAVLARRPTIVYGALHGYLEEGPYAGRPAYDDVIQGECGIADTFAARDGAPALAPTVIADKSAGLLAASGLLAALVKRLRRGRGVYFELGMFEAMVAYTLVEHLFGANFAPPLCPPGYSRVLSPERRPYPTRDGHLCMLAYTDRQWRAFWALAGEPETATDARFVDMAARTRNVDLLYARVGAVLAGGTTAEWLERLAAADIPAGPIRRLADLASDPHLAAIGFFRPYSHPSEGELTVPDTALRFDRAAPPVHRHAPTLGEHGVEVLREAGLDEAAIAAALATGQT